MQHHHPYLLLDREGQYRRHDAGKHKKEDAEEEVAEDVVHMVIPGALAEVEEANQDTARDMRNEAQLGHQLVAQQLAQSAHVQRLELVAHGGDVGAAADIADSHLSKQNGKRMEISLGTRMRGTQRERERERD